MVIKCPKCKHEYDLELDSTVVELTFTCPNCNTRFQVKNVEDSQNSHPSSEQSDDESRFKPTPEFLSSSIMKGNHLPDDVIEIYPKSLISNNHDTKMKKRIFFIVLAVVSVIIVFGYLFSLSTQLQRIPLGNRSDNGIDTVSIEEVIEIDSTQEIDD